MTKTGFIALALAAGVFAQAPAQAQAQLVDWAAAKAAFDAPKSQPPKPVTRGDLIACNVFWTEWMRQGVGPATIAKERGADVHPGLLEQNVYANMTSTGLRLATKIPGEDMAQIRAQTDAMTRQMERAAEESVSKALKGDTGTLLGIMGLLGSCQIMLD